MRTPFVLPTSVVNGSAPPRGTSVTARGMIPIDSYHEAWRTSYVACTAMMSPFLTATRHFGGVAPMETSHDTAPAGS